MLKLDCRHLKNFIASHEYSTIKSQIERAHKFLHSEESFCDNIGWVELPRNYDVLEFNKIIEVAKKIQKDSDILVVVGIGGSYIGARAAIEFLKSDLYNNLPKNTPDIYFVGNSASASSLSDVLELCKDKRISLNVISKSGTTTEPAIAFSVFKEFMEKRYGKKDACSRIYCTTDIEDGDLKSIANENGYETFAIPRNVGGRFSVLTAVGLLPIAVSGANISELMRGASIAHDNLLDEDLEKNHCYKYAAIRNILYRKSKQIEVMAFFEPRFSFLGKWIEQLFGESEGKDHKGIFPTSMIFSTDLHSMGQFIQDGSKNIFETMLFIDHVGKDITVNDNDQIKSLDFLKGKTMSWINKKVFESTAIAHSDGFVPTLILHAKDAFETTLGYIFYFLEKACAISSLVMGVNPFDQPGVESYKKNMFALLGKAGYESRKEILIKKLNKC
ncbi:MAG: glucose-6-phosphate isomerase [Oscillospiraceae bacterium]|nr:glucose-6-phosphate isomerase [Oscillospiraceae bacterium]